MRNDERQTRTHLMGLFAERGLHPRGDLGQNFLIDLNLLHYVVQQGELTPQDLVLEIGAGTGGMTTYLARGAGAVVSVEIDHRMHELAWQAVAPFPNVTLLHMDALKNKNNFHPLVLEAIAQRLQEDPGRKLKLVANLPYHVATPVVSNLVASELPWTRMVITIQWELAEKMAAEPQSDPWAALSVWLQSQCKVKILKKLGPTVFWPRPGVDSAIVLIEPDLERRATIVDRRFFQDFVRRVFSLRRKLLRPVLVGMYRKQLEKPEVDALLAEMQMPPDTRAEELPIETLVTLSNKLRERIPRDAAEDEPVETEPDADGV